jgi:colanic acid biosynthesis glycosyl transferase WcaI
MADSGKIVIVTQHYPPDTSTTAAIMADIAKHLAKDHAVVVLSGAPGHCQTASEPTVIQIKNRMPAKAALVRRAWAELLFTLRAFLSLVRTAQAEDVVLTVTAPFMLPYAVAAAARLKNARSVLIIHDLFPDVLVMTGLLKAASLSAKLMRAVNTLMFGAFNALVTIGRDMERLLLRYSTLTREKIHFIPNWTTLAPAVRPVDANNPYRRSQAARFVVGLSGNLGFTHDPVVVFEAARLLRNEPDIHFLLSGWGVGFQRLQQLQSDASLPNVTLVARVAAEDLESLLAAANVWLIPYRKNVAGVSVPSRFYNLLAVGRPVILISEPDSEAALTVTEHNLGWVVRPERSDELANAIRAASALVDGPMTERAVMVARHFNLERAMKEYGQLMDELLRRSQPEGRPK